MARELKVSIGQCSEAGRKDVNQDFHGALVPAEPLLGAKGITVVLADGISSSSFGRIASESSVKSLLTDYYCTPESWSVKTSVQRVLAATNSWLYAQTRRSQYSYDKDKGYVCALSALVIRASSAHIFHVGDARVYRLSGNTLEQLTQDHRVVLSSEESYLGRALGISPQIEIDYQMLRVEAGDIFVLATDGVYEHVNPRFIASTIRGGLADLDRAASAIVANALEQGSPDNLTIQIVRVDEVSAGELDEVFGQALELPLPPLPEPRQTFDGYRIVRELHASSRSHIYLATDMETEELVALKLPSVDLRGDPAYLKRFMIEEWVARRLDSAHVLKPRSQTRKRNFLYVAMEFIDGITLRQWMIDNPRPDLETVRGIVEQIARGLQTFHRKEMLHQDIRPDNVMIDKTGTVKIIDFGSTNIGGVVEAAPSAEPDAILGTVQYTAPEYFLGEGGTTRSDIFSLGVITYELLTGRLPYGADAAKVRTKAHLRKLNYRSALDEHREIPAWIDDVLARAVHPDPNKRYDELSEFTHELRHPSERYLAASRAPLLERNPLLFWKATTLALFAVVLALLFVLFGKH
jgi:serine/threonine protein phosphatase PrpC/predicted Ser/Thr protein kinase